MEMENWDLFLEWVYDKKNIARGGWTPDLYSVKLWEEFKKDNRPSNDEIKIRIVDTLYGGGDVPTLLKWLKDKLLTK